MFKTITLVLSILFLAGCAAEPKPSPATAPSSASGGMVSGYTIEFQRFTAKETGAILNAMSREWPGYSSHDALSSTSAVRKYEYVTSASAADIHKWLTILLMDMGLDPDGKVEIVQSGHHFRLYKLVR